MDMVRVEKLDRSKVTPHWSKLPPGLMTPEECKIGIMPPSIFRKGSVGSVTLRRIDL